MAFLDAEPRSASVATVGGATVLDFTREALGVLKREAPRVAASILRNLLLDVARRLRDAGEKLVDGSGPRSRADAGGDTDAKRSARGLTAAQLRTIPALASYGDEDLELLAYIATLRTFPRGTVLAKEGTVGDACWLVVSGGVAITRAASSTPLATLGPGALVGQLALLDRAPRSATVSAAEDAVALEVPASAFANLVRAHTPIALRFQEQIALAGVRQLRAATKKLADAARTIAAAPDSMRMIDVDDWDEGGDAPPLELAIDPASSARRR
jgi:hypothetical protein